MRRGRTIVGLLVATIRAAFLSAALCLAAAVIPLVGAITSLFAPTPILLFSVGFAGARLRAALAIMVAAAAVMALGGWMSGAIFDATGSYKVAFVNGVLWNLVTVCIALWLLRRSMTQRQYVAA